MSCAGFLLIFSGLATVLGPQGQLRAITELTSDAVADIRGEGAVVTSHLVNLSDSQAATPRAEEALPERFERAWANAGRRADLLDILAGVPAQLTAEGKELPAALAALPRTCRVIAAQHKDVDVDAVALRQELKAAALQLLAAESSASPSTQRRLLGVLNTSRSDIGSCTPPSGVMPLAVDQRSTSSGATSSNSGLLHQALLRIGAATGLPSLQQRLDMFRSRSAEVLLRHGRPPIGDCFAFKTNSSIAFHLATGGAGARAPHHLVIEQPARWATPRPKTSPRRFSVWGAAADGYNIPMGSFEYVLAGPTAQAFRLAEVQVPLRGIKLNFEFPAWGEPFSCVYRIRAYEESPSCTGHRLVTLFES